VYYIHYTPVFPPRNAKASARNLKRNFLKKDKTLKKEKIFVKEKAKYAFFSCLL
jgi:hypothetical protein